MARADLESVLAFVGLPVVIGSWDEDETPTFPFVEYHQTGDRNFPADDGTYYKVDTWLVSVYAEKTDMAGFYTHCENLEAALDEAGVFYTRSSDIFPGDGLVYASYRFALPR